MNEHGFEPIRGLPEPLPPGETVLWQGKPVIRALALRTFHVGQLAIYFLLLLVWQIAAIPADDGYLGKAATSALWVVAMALVAIGVLVFFAALTSRTTVYTITNRRLAIHFGIALPMTITLPFGIIAAAGVKVHADGSGDIPLTLGNGERISYFLLWPHVRPWRIAHAEPMLRCIPEASSVAQFLGETIAAASAMPMRPAPEPSKTAAPADEARIRAQAAA